MIFSNNSTVVLLIQHQFSREEINQERNGSNQIMEVPLCRQSKILVNILPGLVVIRMLAIFDVPFTFLFQGHGSRQLQHPRQVQHFARFFQTGTPLVCFFQHWADRETPMSAQHKNFIFT